MRRYTVALGTDRRSAQTRSNIYAFEDVGLSLNLTFYGLNLTAKTETYYVTVRAYSGAGSFVESSSDGVKAGYRYLYKYRKFPVIIIKDFEI